MTIPDAQSLQRVAQRLVVEFRPAGGSPPTFQTNWIPLWGAKVERITINRDDKPSVAVIWFPDLRWEADSGLLWGDMVRIRTDEPSVNDRTILFVGFVVSYRSGFSGGTERSKPYERNAVLCQDFRWLLSALSPIFGQRARSPDDYFNYGTPTQAPKDNSWTPLLGRRAIFNADGKPNRDPQLLAIDNSAGISLCEIPIFADPAVGVSWTARDMLRYLLSPGWNKAYQYLPIDDPSLLAGLDHDDWDKVINHIVVEGLNVVEAIQLICKHIGWSFREDYENDGAVVLVFFKITSATGYVRDDDHPVIKHWLHAPAVGDNTADAVAGGKKPLWSMEVDQDIGSVVNNPLGIGAPDRFEFTAELVPAWDDNSLEPDASDDYIDLFFTEADLQDIEDPDSYSYYKHYHPRGSEFRRNVGRKWVLNEAGRYSLTPYDRGLPFDFSSVIPPQYIFNSEGHRFFGPFNRQLLACLTLDEDTLNTVGIRVEFSFDSGDTWQIIPCAIASLKDECGIYISEANLSELVDKKEGQISGGDLDETQLNFWTSLCDDKVNNRSFKEGEWHTRIRVTASVQMDTRLYYQSLPSGSSGSPFWQSQLYDFSEKYGLMKRAESFFADTALAAYELDSTEVLEKHLDGIRKVNEDMSISGLFTLERLWLGDGAGKPDFMVGDSIERITGREYLLSNSFGGGEVFPEIIQIIYMPDKQKMRLVTRDLRFAEVVL